MPACARTLDFRLQTLHFRLPYRQSNGLLIPFPLCRSTCMRIMVVEWDKGCPRLREKDRLSSQRLGLAINEPVAFHQS